MRNSKRIIGAGLESPFLDEQMVGTGPGSDMTDRLESGDDEGSFTEEEQAEGEDAPLDEFEADEAAETGTAEEAEGYGAESEDQEPEVSEACEEELESGAVEYVRDLETASRHEVGAATATLFEHDFTPLGADVERALVTAQITAGERDVEKLTNFIFYIGHPALKGTRLAKGQEALMVEWRKIRDELVLPLLAKTIATPVLRLESVSLGNAPSIPLVRTSAGVYRGTLPKPFEGRVAILGVTGRIEMEESGRRRAYSNADHKKLGPLKVLAVAIPSDGISSSSGREVPLGSSGRFTTETQIGARRPTRFVQADVALKGNKKVTARVVLELPDLPAFLAIVDAAEQGRSSSQSHLSFLASVRKMFQGGPNDPLRGVFDLILHRHRNVKPLFAAGTLGASRLEAYAKGLWADGETVDIGHVLCGIEGSPFQDPLHDQTGVFAVIDPPTRQRLITWAGDLGKALHEYIKKFIKVVDAGEPLNLADFLVREAGRADLIGDTDGINIGAFYEKGRSLAGNLNAYYGTQNRRRYRRFIERSTSASGAPLFPLVPGSNPPKLAVAARRHIAEQVLAFQSALSLSHDFPTTLEPSKRRLYNDIIRKDSAEMAIVVDYFVEFLENGLTKESKQR